MINIDKILGGIVQSVVSGALSPVASKRTAVRTGRSAARAFNKNVDKKVLGMGALGLAIAAYEHFKQPGSGAPPAMPQGSPSVSQGTHRAAPPPPPPGTAQRAAPQALQLQGSPEALVLLRTMVAAASSDGVIDPEEQQSILRALEDVGLTDEERNFVEAEFTRPQPIEGLTSQVTSPQMAEQVYTVALLAINVDQESEKRFMYKLQGLLRLDDATVDRIASTID